MLQRKAGLIPKSPKKSVIETEEQHEKAMIVGGKASPAVSFTGGRPARTVRKAFLFMILFLFLILLAYLVGTLTLYARLAPILKELGLAEAEKEIRQRINNEILAMCERGELDGANLIRLKKNAAGEIVSLETNAGEINRARAYITDQIAKTLNRKKGFTLSVPAGSLTDSGILSWMSIPLRIKYDPLSAVSGEIVTDFSDSGINQTKYSVTAEIKVSYLLLLPGENPKAEVETSFLLGEVVIVGNVPHWTNTQ